MAATEEAVPAVFDVADPPPVPAPDFPAAVKAAKVKKVSKERKIRKPSAHPPYLEMVKDAVISLKERSGSSQYAITKFVENKHKATLPANFKKIILTQLKKQVSSGKLLKVKGSFKLNISVNAKKPATTTKDKKPKPKSASAETTKPRGKRLIGEKKVRSVGKLKKPKKKPVVLVKSKAPLKSKAVVKSKAGTKRKAPLAPAKSKPKTSRPSKVAKTSVKASPAKKAAAASKKIAKKSKKPKKKSATPLKKSRKVTGKSPAKRAGPGRKAKN